MITGTTPTPAPTSPAGTSLIPSSAILERYSIQLQARLVSMREKTGDDGSDIHLILSAYIKSTYIADLKRELTNLRNEILAITADASDPLVSS